MTTLFIHAPKTKVGISGGKSFHNILLSGVAEGYAIPKKDADRIQPEDKVVLLCKHEKKRAEGVLKKLRARDKTETGMIRYKLDISGLHEVPYKPQKLDRTGARVI